MEQTDAYDAYVDDGDPVDLAMAWEAGEARRRRDRVDSWQTMLEWYEADNPNSCD